MSFHRIKPILFNTEMVRAILSGRKTVTRRVIKGARSIFNFLDLELDPAIGITDIWGELKPKDVKGLFANFEADDSYPIEFPMFKSHYQVGDILYVRETWREYNGKYFFKANEMKEYDDYKTLPKWKPSIHMPKEAARIWLKVTDVRVERLQDIMDSPYGKDNQIVKEGCDYGCDFIAVWDSTINKKDIDSYGWDANPWVWVIEFERIER